MDSKAIHGQDADFAAHSKAGAAATPELGMRNHYHLECRDKHGQLKWVEEMDNIVPNVGLNDVLEQYLKGAGYTAAFFVGLTDGTPTVAAGDTMASHPGWAELAAYDEATRPALTLGTVAAQSVDNSASRAVFTISANSTTIGGAFIATVNTKSGTGGVLYSVAAFNAGDKGLDDGDTLNVTVTCTATAV